LTLAKLTSKNQLTIPKKALEAVQAETYFQLDVENGRIILTPARLTITGDEVRRKIAKLGITEQDVHDAVKWARQQG